MVRGAMTVNKDSNAVAHSAMLEDVLQKWEPFILKAASVIFINVDDAIVMKTSPSSNTHLL